MKNRRAYFYTIDVVIGIIVLALGLFLIAGIYFYAPQKGKTESIATDITGILSNVRIEDLCTQTTAPCSCSYVSLNASCQYLANEKLSLLELIGLLYHKNRRSLAEGIINETIVFNNVLPANHDMIIVLQDPEKIEPQQLYPLITA